MRTALASFLLLGLAAVAASGQAPAEPAKTTADMGRALHEKMISLAAKSADASTPESLRLAAQHDLEAVVSQQFDLMVEAKRKEITDTEARLVDLRKVLAEKISAKQSIVDARVKFVLAEFAGFGWGFNPKPKAPVVTTTTK